MVYLDDNYLIRGKHNLHLYVDTFCFDTDHKYSTSHNYEVCKTLAIDLLSIYLKT